MTLNWLIITITSGLDDPDRSNSMISLILRLKPDQISIFAAVEIESRNLLRDYGRGEITYK